MRRAIECMCVAVLAMALPVTLFPVGAPAAALDSEGSIYGTVTDSAGGAPVAGATVVVWYDEFAGEGPPLMYGPITTDDSGAYEFLGVESGANEFVVEAFKDGYANAVTDSFTWDGTAVQKDLEITEAPRALSGTVRTDTDNTPWPGVAMVLNLYGGWRPGPTRITDDQGNYCFYGLDNPTVIAELDAHVAGCPEWVPWPEPLNYMGDEITGVDFYLTPPQPAHFCVDPRIDAIWGDAWRPDAEVTITIDDGGAGAEFHTTTNQYGEFGLWPVGDFDILGGHEVTVDDGETSLTHVVTELGDIEVDAETDTVSGHAAPGSEVQVAIHPHHSPARQVTADPVTGAWTADFSDPVGDDPGDEAYDLLPGTCGFAAQYETGVYPYYWHAVTWVSWNVWRPEGWQHNRATGHDYLCVWDEGVPSWADAEAYAVALGGHLVTVNDQAEMDWLVATFGADYFIGLNDVDVEGEWVWASGEPVMFTDWLPNEPDNMDVGGADAAVVANDPPVGWADTRTEQTLEFVVEVVAEEVDCVSVAGATRVETAIEASKKAFPTGASCVVIATGRNWPDALGGSALAGVKHAPILVTEPGVLPSCVLAEIERLGVDDAIVLGGEGAVSEDVFAALQSTLGVGHVERIGGATRYETARMIAQEVIGVMDDGSGFDGTGFVATGRNFPDALAAAPLAAAKGRPIYLAFDGVASAMQADGISDAVILGGAGVVSESTEDALDTAFGLPHVTRLWGANRYETAVAVANWGVSDCGLYWDGVALATGQNFPDALSGGVLQGRSGSVMVLTPSDSLHPSVAGVLEANREWISEVRYLGGTGAISQEVRDAVEAVLD